MELSEVLDAVKSGEITQVDLAERAGLSTSAVSQICSSTIKSPRYANAVALINALQAFRKEKSNGEPREETDEKQTKPRKSSVKAVV